MASTPSSNLRLELMTTGERSSQWGDVLNENLRMLDGAVSGVTTLAIADSTVPTVLAVSDFAAGPYHNMAFRLTGTLSADRALEVPARQRVFLIENLTDGGCGVTVRVSGHAGFFVPNGTVAWLYCDGAEVRGAIGGSALQPFAFTGDGSRTAFPLSGAPAGLAASSLFVIIGGVLQTPGAAYTVTAGATPTLQLTEAPPAGVSVRVVVLATAVTHTTISDGSAVPVTAVGDATPLTLAEWAKAIRDLQTASPLPFSFTGDGATTAFALTGAPAGIGPTAVLVNIEGTLQIPAAAYTIEPGPVLRFTEAPPSGAVISAVVLTTAVSYTTLADGSSVPVTAPGSTTPLTLAQWAGDISKATDFLNARFSSRLHKKKVVAKLPLLFPDYAFLVARDGNTYLYPQGFFWDEKANQILVAYNGSGGTVNRIIAAYDAATCAYQGCYQLSLNNSGGGENFTVVYKADGKRYLLNKYDASNVAYFDITAQPANRALVAPASIVPLAMYFQMSYNNGQYLLEQSGPAIGGATSRTVFGVYNDALNRTGQLSFSRFDSGFQAAEDNALAPYIPKRQGIALGDGFVVTAHGGIVMFDGTFVDRKYSYQGVRLYTTDGHKLYESICEPRAMKAIFEANGLAVTRFENEGVCFTESGRIVTLNLYQGRFDATAGTEGIVLLEEFSAAPDAIDFTPAVFPFVHPSRPEIEAGTFARSSDGKLYNPVTGALFTTMAEVMDFMKIMEVRQFSYYAPSAGLTPLDGLTLDTFSHVRITNFNSTTMHLDVVSNSRSRRYWVLESSGARTVSPLASGLLLAQNKLRYIQAQMAAGQAVTFACYGDSTTDGFGTTGFVANATDANGDAVGAAANTSPNAWPAKLQGILRAMFNNSNISVWNAGYTGKLLSDGWAYRNYDKAVVNNPAYGLPAVCFIAFGLNDIKLDGTAIGNHVNETRKLIQKQIAAGTLPVLLTCDAHWHNDVDLVGTDERDHKESVRQIDNAKAAIADEFGIPIFDVGSALKAWFNRNTDGNRWATAETDGLHVGDAGHAFKAGYLAAQMFNDVVLVRPGDPRRVCAFDSAAAYVGNRLTVSKSTNTEQGGTVTYASGAPQNAVMMDLWVWNESADTELIYRGVDEESYRLAGTANAPKIKVIDQITGGETAKTPAGVGGFYTTGSYRRSDQPYRFGHLPYGLSRVQYISGNSDALYYGNFEMWQTPKGLTSVNALKHPGRFFADFTATTDEQAVLFPEFKDGSNVYGLFDGEKVDIYCDVDLPVSGGLILAHCADWGNSTPYGTRNATTLYRSATTTLAVYNTKTTTPPSSYSLASGTLTTTTDNLKLHIAIQRVGDTQELKIYEGYGSTTPFLTRVAPFSDSANSGYPVHWAGAVGGAFWKSTAGAAGRVVINELVIRRK